MDNENVKFKFVLYDKSGNLLLMSAQLTVTIDVFNKVNNLLPRIRELTYLNNDNEKIFINKHLMKDMILSIELSTKFKFADVANTDCTFEVRNITDDANFVERISLINE